ncbi:MAG: MFS transporter [Bacillales bacterium]|nr:MFS transporter [Bacillales bacterium]
MFFSVLRLKNINLLLRAVSNIFLLTVSQLLHSFTFALYHICAMYVLSRNTNQTILGQRQTTYTVITMGIAAAIGSYLSGVLWNNKLLHVSSFVTVGVFSALISSLLIIFIMRTERRQINEKRSYNYHQFFVLDRMFILFCNFH